MNLKFAVCLVYSVTLHVYSLQISISNPFSPLLCLLPVTIQSYHTEWDRCAFCRKVHLLISLPGSCTKWLAASTVCWQVKATRIFIVCKQVVGFQLCAKHVVDRADDWCWHEQWQFPHHKCCYRDWQRQLEPIKFSAVPDKIGEWKGIFGR